MLINQHTQASIEAFIARPVGSLIVAGTRFSGTFEIISQLQNSILEGDNKNSVLTLSKGNDNTIGVEKIRELKQWLTTRFSNSDRIARIVVIEESELMTHEAQNALLKLLEEPNADTVIILESSERVRLLDTIRSRCKILKVLPIQKDYALKAATAKGLDENEINSAYALSGGEALLFEELISKKDSELTQNVTKAKEFLKLTTFDRLKKQPDYTQSGALMNLILALGRVCEAAMTHPMSNVGQWSVMLRTIKQAEVLLERNTAPKLVYTFICVNL